VGDVGHEQPAVLIDDESAVVVDADPAGRDVVALIRAGAHALAHANAGDAVGLADVRVGAPLMPGKIVCVGLNYRDHAREGGNSIPEQPILFLKVPDTVVGPNDTVLIPRDGEKTDWEVELGVVIGREVRRAEDDDAARAAIAGYVLCNDVSERHFQLELGGQWDKGKNCPTFFPMGPYLVTADEVPDPQNLAIGLDVNGTTFQDSSTSSMIFGVVELVRYISRFMSLYPGDVISTGTPAGVGAGQQPERYLRDGDVMHAWAQGLGEMASPVRRA
jgi:2-keto-4-pentenoate hydratase/2-oxohepta-3-ene-1,7-dioic acid hydratase in catechol pathway